MRWIQLLLLFMPTVVLVLCSGTNETDTKSCDPTQFSCRNGRCISIAWKCDNDDDCSDNSDELECPSTTCAGNDFRCNNGRCIPKRWTCDDSSDCADDSDENPELCKNQTCNGYRCNNYGQCIPEVWRCDGHSDCPKGDDEADCNNTCDRLTEFMCGDKTCISIQWRCDKHVECADGTDELDCPETETSCDPNGEKMCKNGECINELWWCDGDADCIDKSDETNCTGTNQMCAANEFQCKLPLVDIQCILFAWKCDGNQDCSDGSDEFDCGPHTCSSDEKRCGNNSDTCVKAYYICDGDDDCGNGEDEQNCNETVAEPGHCERGQFDCGSKCISDELICNLVDDCGNGADEAPERKCPSGTDNICTVNHGGCNQICVPNTLEESGRRCECYLGFDFADNSDTECEDVDECKISGTCSQVCTNTKGSYKCECFTGFTLTNHRYCKASEGDHAELILSDHHGIRRYHMDTYHYSLLLQQKIDVADAMDFNYRKKLIYWTDVQAGEISSVSLVSNETKVIVAENITMPGDLAVDWIYGNLYISDTGLKKIEVVSLDGSIRKTLVSTNLNDPRALVVDPSSGWMYWTDWGNKPKIEKCGMNGQHRTEIVTSNIGWPNGLTIDYTQKRLYWVDAKLHSIGSTDLDGNNYKLVLKSHRHLGHPYAIAVFEDYLYWTDWLSNAVQKVSKFGRDNVSTIALGLRSPMGIHVYHISRQPASTNECGENNGGCSHLCLPVPRIKTSSPVPKRTECACPDTMILDGHFNCLQSSATDKKSQHVTDVPSLHQPETLTPDTKTKVNPESETTVIKSEAETTAKSTSEEEEVTQSTAGNITHLENVQQKDNEGAGYIAGIAIGSLMLVGSAVCAVAYYLLKRHKSRNVKSMNFDNPVYRKTTTEDQLIMEKNGSRSNLPQSMQPLNQDLDIV